MEPEILVRLLLLTVLLGLSAFFSGSEVAFFSLDPLLRKKAAASEERSSRHLVWLLNHPRRLIITLLVGNELVNISTSTVSATLASHYFAAMNEVERTLLSIVIVVPVLLIVGEITPKTIAFFNSHGWSRRAASPLWLFSWLITPLRWILSAISWVFIRLFGVTEQVDRDKLQEEDFLMLVEKGSRQGKINDQENDLIKNVFRFGDALVKHIMTPREKIVTLDINMALPEILEVVKGGAYSRVPVFRTSTGELLGVLHVKDLLKRKRRPLLDIIRPPFYVSQNTKCLRLLTEFQNRRLHMAFVLNETGKVSGIVTIEDLLEELVGEIHDEKELPVAPGGDQP